MAIFNVCTRCHKTMWFTKATKCTSCVEHDERINVGMLGLIVVLVQAVYTPCELAPVHVPSTSTYYDGSDNLTNAVITANAYETETLT